MLDLVSFSRKFSNFKSDTIGILLSVVVFITIEIMVDKIDILSNFDIDNSLSDCSTDENMSDLSLSDISSENGEFEDCSNLSPSNRNSDTGHQPNKIESLAKQSEDNLKKQVKFMYPENKKAPETRNIELSAFGKYVKPMADQIKLNKEKPSSPFKFAHDDNDFQYLMFKPQIQDDDADELSHYKKFNFEKTLLNNTQNDKVELIVNSENFNFNNSGKIVNSISNALECCDNVRENDKNSNLQKCISSNSCEESPSKYIDLDDSTENNNGEIQNGVDCKSNLANLKDDDFKFVNSGNNTIKDISGDISAVKEFAGDEDSKTYQNESDRHLDTKFNEKNELNDKITFANSNLLAQNSARSTDSFSTVGFNKESVDIITSDKRFQNSQDKINLLNLLMFEAENKTEKCGSLYNSFTNEINNNFVYSKATEVVDDYTGSLVSLVDVTSSKFDDISVKSELLFSDYGKSENNFDISESQERDDVKTVSLKFDNLSVKSELIFSECGKSESNFDITESHEEDNTENNTNCIIENNIKNDKMNIDTNNISSQCTVCGIDKSENNIDLEDENLDNEPKYSLDDRVTILWNQIIRLKCSLKNLQLNLKEQQMETLMQINDFLIHQNINSNQIFNNNRSRIQNSNSCPLLDRENDSKHLNKNISESSLIFPENNKLKEDLALNNLKIALIECNMLSSTASLLVNSIPKYENEVSSTIDSSSDQCCCNLSKPLLTCSCSGRIHNCVESRTKCTDKQQINRKHYLNTEDQKDRKVKSNEEIINKFPETKCSLSECIVYEDLSLRS